MLTVTKMSISLYRRGFSLARKDDLFRKQVISEAATLLTTVPVDTYLCRIGLTTSLKELVFTRVLYRKKVRYFFSFEIRILSSW